MDPIYIDYWMHDTIHSMYPNRETYPNLKCIRWWNRYIQLATVYHPQGLGHIHYEICPNGYWELHIEGRYEQKWADLAQYLYLQTQNDDRLSWFPRGDYDIGTCRYDQMIEDGNSSKFKEYLQEMVNIIDPLLVKYKNIIEVAYDNSDYDPITIEPIVNGNTDEEVTLVDNLLLDDIFHLNISIPDYQRIYCWEEKNVRRLLDDILNAEGAYRMGAIILHHHDNVFDIIDGQQRLVTLSLILRKLGYDGSPLLKLSFASKEAMHYVAYNRFIIDNFINANVLTGRHEKVKFLLRNLQFSVLILNTDQIDLAYTFFSNENSRGKSLSDFDLLKAHHLRFITDDMQAGHLAKSWDKMLSDANLHYDNDIDKPYYRSLGLYIFRLRKWMGNEDWDDFAKYKIKDEYEAAPVIDEIPPFGEQFSYKESIQGGTHFFAFVKRFEYKYHLFVQTDEFKSIHKLDNRTHWWFRDVIETFLFAYYLKFGVDYLSEALLAISRIVLQFRFDYKKADYSRLLRQAGDSGIIYMIDCATSPTFALAEMEKKVRSLPSINIDVSPVARDFNRQLREYLAPIRKHIVINKFKLI